MTRRKGEIDRAQRRRSFREANSRRPLLRHAYQQPSQTDDTYPEN